MSERRLLEAARGGDEDAFARLVEPHRGALHAHCYRMLGSVHDAEDALREALLRAWRGLSGFEGRSSLRSWLYAIATNACLRAIERRPKRMLPIDYAPAADPHDGLGEPLVESVWVEPGHRYRPHHPNRRPWRRFPGQPPALVCDLQSGLALRLPGRHRRRDGWSGGCEAFGA
jgi:hypothetical protein